MLVCCITNRSVGVYSAGVSGLAATSPLIDAASGFVSAKKVYFTFLFDLILIFKLPLSSSWCGGLLATTSSGGIDAGASGSGGICGGDVGRQDIDSYLDRLALDSVASAVRTALVRNDRVDRACDNDLLTLVALVHIDTGEFDTDDDTVALDVRTAGFYTAIVVALPGSHHMQHWWHTCVRLTAGRRRSIDRWITHWTRNIIIYAGLRLSG